MTMAGERRFNLVGLENIVMRDSFAWFGHEVIQFVKMVYEMFWFRRNKYGKVICLIPLVFSIIVSPVVIIVTWILAALAYLTRAD